MTKITHWSFSKAFRLYLEGERQGAKGVDYLDILEKRVRIEQDLSKAVNQEGELLSPVFIRGRTERLIHGPVLSYCFSWLPLRRYEEDGETTYSRQGAFDAATLVYLFLNDVREYKGSRVVSDNNGNGSSQGRLTKEMRGFDPIFFWEKKEERWVFELPLDIDYSESRRIRINPAIFFRPSTLNEESVKNRFEDSKGLHWMGYDLSSHWSTEPVCFFHFWYAAHKRLKMMRSRDLNADINIY